VENASFGEKAYPWGLPGPFSPALVRETMARVVLLVFAQNFKGD